MKTFALRAAAAAALLAVVGGCTDSVTSDAGRAPAGPSRGLVSGLLTSVVQRVLPLQQNYAASATIGSAGGSIRIPEAGFTITFPAGAVSAPVTVRATALAGNDVAYRLEPHGIVFAKEPTIAQDLSLTGVVSQLLTAGIQGGYIPDESTLARGSAVVTETRPATLDLLRLRTTFTVKHFSAYAVTSAKKSGGYFGSSNTRLTGGSARP